MADLIDRQATIEALDAILPVEPMKNEYTQGITCGAALAIEYVKQLPSAQAEIIRCKDCKHWREGTSFSYCDKLHGMGVLDTLDYMTAEDDYCSMAERREK